MERAEQEREFYFEKLQDVEFLCQRPEFVGQHLTCVVERILYHRGKADVEAIIAECDGGRRGGRRAVVSPERLASRRSPRPPSRRAHRRGDAPAYVEETAPWKTNRR